ncbi:MAG: RDD family protein [Desulfuromonas sp.]|nr:RDD family protein [Desulfuromonas sp.]
MPHVRHSQPQTPQTSLLFSPDEITAQPQKSDVQRDVSPTVSVPPAVDEAPVLPAAPAGKEEPAQVFPLLFSNDNVIADAGCPVDVDPAPVVDDGRSETLIGRRVAATVIDLLLMMAVLSVFVLLSQQLLSWTPAQWLVLLQEHAAVRLAYYLLLVLTLFSYFFLSHYGCGQTVGKGLMGLRVVSVDGSELSLSQVLLRTTGGVLSLLSVGLGFVLAVRDVQQRGWSDRLASTRVIGITDREEKEDWHEIC